MTTDIKDISKEINDNVTIKGINELFDVDNTNVDIKTDLEDGEIKQILRLSFIAKAFKIQYLETFLTKYMRLRLSNQRKSRKEIVEMVKADLTNEMQMSNSFRGLRNGLSGKI